MEKILWGERLLSDFLNSQISILVSAFQVQYRSSYGVQRRIQHSQTHNTSAKTKLLLFCLNLYKLLLSSFFSFPEAASFYLSSGNAVRLIQAILLYMYVCLCWSSFWLLHRCQKLDQHKVCILSHILLQIYVCIPVSIEVYFGAVSCLSVSMCWVFLSEFGVLTNW